MRLKTMILATGIEKLDKAFSAVKGFEAVDIVKTKKDLEEIYNFYKSDILIVSEELRGSQSLKEILFRIINQNKDVRIIYLAGTVNMKDEHRVNSLGYLVLSGVTDIIVETKFNMETLEKILNKPKSFDDVSIFTKNITATEMVSSTIEFEEEEDEALESGYDPYSKIHVVSSLKPGSGKTMISSGIATAIAKYGKKKGSYPPKVAIIEADLQNKSLGTVLQIKDDNKWNLKVAMDAIATLFNEEGELISRAGEMDEVNRIIKNCMKPYYHAKNLHVLAGSQIGYKDLQNIKPHYYIYLVEALLDDYDVIIIDSNSSIEHVTTEPIMYMAKNCYYVLNLDFNNVRNNANYREDLKRMNIYDKVKYVLNEDVEENSEIAGTNIEPLEFGKEQLKDSGFNVVAEIPLLPKAIMLNRIYEGKPFVLDDNEYTLKARYEMFKICNEIWEIEGFGEIERQVLGIDDNKKKKKKKGFFNRR